MTKATYLEMMEMLGEEPVPEDIPVEYEDLLVDVQQALNIYFKLKDEYNGLSGHYMGKNYSDLFMLFKLYDVPAVDHRCLYELISRIDAIRSAAINKASKAKSPSKR
jgi:hypothetical protein